MKSRRRISVIFGLLFICSFFVFLGGIGSSGIANAATASSGSAVSAIPKAASKVMYVNRRKIKMYSGKSESSTVVQTLRRNNKVKLLSRVSNGWVKIKAPSGKTGYVLKKQLSSESFKTRSLKAIEKEGKILEAAIADNGWEITEDSGNEYRSATGTHIRMLWVKKGNYSIDMSFCTFGWTHGGIRIYYNWILYEGDRQLEIEINLPIYDRNRIMTILSSH